jgi:hypothetical protein
MAQLHKKFTNEQVKDLMNRYSRGEIKREHVQTILNIGKSRFFSLLNLYRKDPIAFSIAYKRTKATRIIAKPIEQNIIKELVVAKKFIDNKDMPIWSYNYSFIKNDLEKRYRQQVSVPTIIAKAKKYGFYISKPEKKKAHDREVITNNVGELIQHDSSLHLWSPYASCKWWLITSIDDFSRFLLFALLVFRDISIAHIRALQTVFLKYGVPLSFYVDCDSIFKFIRVRDELHYKHLLQTDETMPQWKQVCFDCQVKVINALSPQAKGKVERPYGWIQDHLVRICARENVTTIAQANQILQREVYEYNYKRIHSTTGEIPYLRYQRALKEKKSIFRQFLIPPPYQSIKDIFCFRLNRTVDAYRTVSINNLKLKFNNAPIHEEVNLRIYPYATGGLSEVRFWYKNKLLDIQKAKTELLGIVHF